MSLPFHALIGPSLALRVLIRATHKGWRYVGRAAMVAVLVVRELALAALIHQQFVIGNS